MSPCSILALVASAVVSFAAMANVTAAASPPESEAEQDSEPSLPRSPPVPAAPNESPGAEADELSKALDDVMESEPPPSETRRVPAIGGSGLLNPEISVIFDGVAGAASGPRIIVSGDDPAFDGPVGKPTGGITLQELEIGLQSTVDPYFVAAAFLAIPNLDGVEVEEAYATTTSLPLGLQLKAGIFRSVAGRQNEQHLHVQSFSLRPLLNAAYLGEDGLRPPGAQLSWLIPVPWYLRLTAEVLSPAPGSSPTFGGALRSAPALLGNVKTFVPVGEAWSVLAGGTLATGHAPPPGLTPDTALDANGPRTLLGGVDLYVKYVPPNRVEHFFWFALQSEYFVRRTSDLSGSASGAQVDAGFYAQLVMQLSRRWHTGVRYDRLGLPASDLQKDAEQISMMAMFTPSEFSRVRLQGDAQKVAGDKAVFEALLLLEYSIGAHGAHSF